MTPGAEKLRRQGGFFEGVIVCFVVVVVFLSRCCPVGNFLAGMDRHADSLRSMLVQLDGGGWGGKGRRLHARIISAFGHVDGGVSYVAPPSALKVRFCSSFAVSLVHLRGRGDFAIATLQGKWRIVFCLRGLCGMGMGAQALDGIYV